MSKYKVGDKIVFTVTGTTEMKDYKFYVLNDNSALWESSTDKYTEPLSTYTEPMEAKIRRQAAEITRLLAENKELKKDLEYYHTGTDICDMESVRITGQNEAWELARKLENLDLGSLLEIFKECNCYKKIYNYTYQETAKKVEEWEKTKEEIKVGDVLEYIYDSNVKCIVTNIYPDNRAYLVFDDGTTGMNELDNFKKTERHINIDNFLKQIGGEQE